MHCIKRTVVTAICMMSAYFSFGSQPSLDLVYNGSLFGVMGTNTYFSSVGLNFEIGEGSTFKIESTLYVLPVTCLDLNFGWNHYLTKNNVPAGLYASIFNLQVKFLNIGVSSYYFNYFFMGWLPEIGYKILCGEKSGLTITPYVACELNFITSMTIYMNGKNVGGAGMGSDNKIFGITPRFGIKIGYLF